MMTEWSLWLLIALVVAAVVGGLSSALFLTLRYYDRQRAESRKYKAELSLVREYLDTRLEEINKAVADSYELWNDTNRLLIEAQNPSEETLDTNESFLTRLGIDSGQIEVNPRQVMVLMPILDRHEPVLRAIKAACTKNYLEAYRSDQTFVHGNLLKTIVESILRSSIVVCDISARNPNVMYELGIAHAFNKNVLIIAAQTETSEFPFDIQSNRILLYKNQFDLEQNLTNALADLRKVRHI